MFSTFPYFKTVSRVHDVDVELDFCTPKRECLTIALACLESLVLLDVFTPRNLDGKGKNLMMDLPYISL